jgi:centromeric protein E
MEDSSSSIQVGIRIRPLGPKENIATDYFAWKIKGNVLARINSSGKLLDGEQFEFSRVFGPESDNAVVYRNCVAPLVESALQGFNATVFAYGQTASGKTHTMTGNSNDPGLIPLALREIFKGIQAIQDREFLLRISLLEIYNEELKDLFDPSRNDLGLFADKDKSYSVKNLSEHIITSADQALDMILASEKNRHYGKTEMNDISSRSHVILKLVCRTVMPIILFIMF